MKATFEININVSIRQIEPFTGGQGLTVQETLPVSADGFLDVCKILAEFHALAERLKTERTAVDPRRR